MYSNLFFRTIDTLTQDSYDNKIADPVVQLYILEVLKFQKLVPDLLRFLSETEYSRAERYHFPKDKNRFIICRALLKFVLAEHIGLDIDDVIIDVDSSKKPYLPSHPSVHFNMSHAVDYAIIAIAKNPVGVDIEYINREFNYKDILTTVCHQHEMDAIESSRDKPHTFYKFWTRKEALVKAIGKGLDDTISKIATVDGSHSVPLTLVGDHKKINVFSFNVNDHYIGALALTSDLHHVDEISF